jgi:low temperature requirement protein LtrA
VNQRKLPGVGRERVIRPLTPRDPVAEHRTATPLELFFDLVSVVAVALAAEYLHEGLAHGQVSQSIFRYFIAFFGLWWAWVNFTWFASAYDSDDVIYRLFVFVTMTGALILAAGIPGFFEHLDRGLTVLGYVVMRLALVTQWIRVARSDLPRRRTATRYAVGVTLCQLGWVATIVWPDLWGPVLFVLGPAEFLVPWWAESAGATPWHPRHILERYGLFMIIVLGESVLAGSLAIQSATDGSQLSGELLQIIAGGLLIVYSLWWIYFDRPQDRLLASTRTALIWGYVHLLIFGSVAAVGAGLALTIEASAGPVELGPVATSLAIAVPIAIFLLSLLALHFRSGHSIRHWLEIPTLTLLVLAASWTDVPVLVIGGLLAGFVAIKVAARPSRSTH